MHFFLQQLYVSFVCLRQIAPLLLQRAVNTISKRARGRESLRGVLWWRGRRQIQGSGAIFGKITHLPGRLSGKGLPLMPLQLLLQPMKSQWHRKKPLLGGRHRSNVSCQKMTSCWWCSSEPIRSWLLPPHIVYSAPEGKHSDIDLIRKLPTNKGFRLLGPHQTSLTGNVPGRDTSKNDTREFGGAEKPTAEPENNLVLELICAWISKPTTPTRRRGSLKRRTVRKTFSRCTWADWGHKKEREK